jgi:hypothetical protein
MQPFCFYCDREFDDEKTLIMHQKAKHFKCLLCNKKMATTTALGTHMQQVHKERLLKVPNAKEGRDGLEFEIFGMEGVPEEFLTVVPSTKRQRVHGQEEEEAAEGGAGAGPAGAAAGVGAGVGAYGRYGGAVWEEGPLLPPGPPMVPYGASAYGLYPGYPPYPGLPPLVPGMLLRPPLDFPHPPAFLHPQPYTPAWPPAGLVSDGGGGGWEPLAPPPGPPPPAPAAPAPSSAPHVLPPVPGQTLVYNDEGESVEEKRARHPRYSSSAAGGGLTELQAGLDARLAAILG